MTTMTQTSFVHGWMIVVPLLILFGLVLWAALGSVGPDPEDEQRRATVMMDAGFDPDVAWGHVEECDGCPICDPVRVLFGEDWNAKHNTHGKITWVKTKSGGYWRCSYCGEARPNG